MAGQSWMSHQYHLGFYFWCYLVKHTNVLGNLNPRKYIQFGRSLMIILAQELSMDHLISAQPGLIPQIIWRLTCMQISGATVIVDHYSDHVYVFLMCNLSLEETLLAKHAYERFLSSIDNLLIRASKMIAQWAIDLFCVVVLEVIIRMVLLNARSKNWLWALELFFSMLKKCFHNTFRQSYGHLP